MKRHSLFIPILFILFTACVKDPIPCRTDPAERCPIVNLKATSPTGASGDEYAIYYNTAGNPDSVLLRSYGPPFSQLDYFFRYDRYGRLTGFIQSYSQTRIFYQAIPGALLWDSYTYLSRNTVVDSFYAYGSALVTDPTPANMAFSYATILKLDDKGRIIRVQNVNDPSFTSYQYDARGNLIRDGVTYDNKVNPYRTSPVWQFVFKDFSKNNPSKTFYNGPETITGFNAAGLPLAISSSDYLFGIIWNTGLTFTYACDIGHPAP